MKRAFILTGCVIFLLAVNFTGISYKWCHFGDPEIIDDTGDVTGYFGYQYRWLLFQQIDITSAWFFEDPEKPESLHILLEIKNQRPSMFLTMYTVNFTLNGTRYSTILMTRFGGFSKQSILMKVESGLALPDYGTVNLDGNQIHFQIWKEVLGNPIPGDVCSQPKAWTIVSMGGFIASWEDIAPDSGWGDDYVIKY